MFCVFNRPLLNSMKPGMFCIALTIWAHAPVCAFYGAVRKKIHPFPLYDRNRTKKRNVTIGYFLRVFYGDMKKCEGLAWEFEPQDPANALHASTRRPQISIPLRLQKPTKSIPFMKILQKRSFARIFMGKFKHVFTLCARFISLC